MKVTIKTPVSFRGSSYHDYKDFFLEYFSDSQRFAIEVNLEGLFERMIVKSTNKYDFLRLELLFVSENGSYTKLFDIRYKHPHSPGFTKLQDDKPLSLEGQFNQFTAERLALAVQQIEERLQFGWEEFRYFKKGKYYKSKVYLPSTTHPKIFIYRKDKKGLGYILLSSLFSRFYHVFTKQIRIEHKIIQPDWV
ncbi:MAG: hypothetical protein ACPGJS_00340 [Flammeovirgaceae bacterium]